MKKIKTNKKQNGGYSMPQTAAPGGAFRYQPLGMEGLRDPLTELQGNINVARQQLEDVEFPIQTTGNPYDAERADELQRELVLNIENIQEIFNKTNDYSFVTRELKKQNKFYNKDKEIQYLRGNAQAKSEFNAGLQELNKKDPEKWPSWWIEAIAHDRDREYNKKGGANFDPTTNKGNAYNDRNPQEYLEKEIQDLAIKLAQHDPEDYAGWVSANGTDLQKDLFGQSFANIGSGQPAFIKLKTSEDTAKDIMDILKTAERYKNWAREEGRMIHNVSRDNSGNPTAYDQGILDGRIGQLSKRYDELEQTGDEKHAAELENISSDLDYLYNLSANGSPEAKEQAASTIAKHKNQEKRLGLAYTIPYGNWAAYMAQDKTAGDDQKETLTGLTVPEKEDLKIPFKIVPMTISSGTTRKEVTGKALSGLVTSTGGEYDLLEEVTTEEYSTYGDSKLLNDLAPATHAAEQIKGFDIDIEATNTAFKEATGTEKQKIFKDLLRKIKKREDFNDYLNVKLTTDTYNKIADKGAGDFLDGLKKLYTNHTQS
jgi:hypothetical protein